MNDKVFRDLAPEEYRWHTEVQGDPKSICELLWIDGMFDNGWQIGMGLLRARPIAGGHPAITIKLESPDGKVTETNATFAHEEFSASEGLTARWGEANRIVGRLDESGRLAGYSLELQVENVRVSMDATTVCSGVKFVSASPGYTVHDPKTHLAVGW